jgi:hypothetical protein
VEVILHVRRADVTWFNDNDIFAQTLVVLQTSILPRKLSAEIETNFFKYEALHHGRTTTQQPPEHIGPGGIPLCVGTSTAAAPAAAPKQTGKRGRGPSKAAAAKAAAKKRAPERSLDEGRPQKTERDVFYATSSSAQFVYRLEDRASSHASATLLTNDDTPKSTKSTNVTFTALHKLSQRIILWCYPRELFDTPNNRSTNNNDDDAPDSPGKGLPPFLAEGFVRPELIPLAELFAQQPVPKDTGEKPKAIPIDVDDE